jgi:hypothetical protein
MPLSGDDIGWFSEIHCGVGFALGSEVRSRFRSEAERRGGQVFFFAMEM